MFFLSKKNLFLINLFCIFSQTSFAEESSSQALALSSEVKNESEKSLPENIIAKESPKVEITENKTNKEPLKEALPELQAKPDSNKIETEKTSSSEGTVVIKQFENFPLTSPLELKRKPTFVEKKTEIENKQGSKDFDEKTVAEEIKKTKANFFSHWINGFKKQELISLEDEKYFHEIINSAAESISHEHFVEIFSQIEKLDLLDQFKKVPNFINLISPSFKNVLESIFNFIISFKHLTFYEEKNFATYIKENLKINKQLTNTMYLVDLWSDLIDYCFLESKIKNTYSKIEKYKNELNELANHRPKMSSFEKKNLETVIALSQKEILYKLVKDRSKTIEDIIVLLKNMNQESWLENHQELVKMHTPAFEGERPAGFEDSDMKNIVGGKILDAKNEFSLLDLRIKKQDEDLFHEMDSNEERFSQEETKKPWLKKRKNDPLNKIFFDL